MDAEKTKAKTVTKHRDGYNTRKDGYEPQRHSGTEKYEEEYEEEIRE